MNGLKRLRLAQTKGHVRLFSTSLNLKQHRDGSLPYEIRPSPGKGLGVFATRPLQRFDVIMRDPLVFNAGPLHLAPHELMQSFKQTITDPSIGSKILGLCYTPVQNDYNDDSSYNHNFQPIDWKNPRERESELRSHLARIVDQNAIPIQLEPEDEDSPVPGLPGLPGLPVRARAIFLDTARINHSCVPNAENTFRDRITDTNVVIANQDIKEGDEITISYINRLLPLATRREILMEQWGFRCQCPACSVMTSRVHERKLLRLRQILEDSTLKRVLAAFKVRPDFSRRHRRHKGRIWTGAGRWMDVVETFEKTGIGHHEPDRPLNHQDYERLKALLAEAVDLIRSHPAFLKYYRRPFIGLANLILRMIGYWGRNWYDLSYAPSTTDVIDALKARRLLESVVQLNTHFYGETDKTRKEGTYFHLVRTRSNVLLNRPIGIPKYTITEILANKGVESHGPSLKPSSAVYARDPEEETDEDIVRMRMLGISRERSRRAGRKKWHRLKEIDELLEASPTTNPAGTMSPEELDELLEGSTTTTDPTAITSPRDFEEQLLKEEPEENQPVMDPLNPVIRRVASEGPLPDMSPGPAPDPAQTRAPTQAEIDQMPRKLQQLIAQGYKPWEKVGPSPESAAEPPTQPKRGKLRRLSKAETPIQPKRGKLRRLSEAPKVW